jgi:hypothetical protein
MVWAPYEMKWNSSAVECAGRLHHHSDEHDWHRTKRDEQGTPSQAIGSRVASVFGEDVIMSLNQHVRGADRKESEAQSKMAGRALVVNQNTAPATEEQIRQRAYELYLKGGQQEGKETEHWLQAEAELNHSQQQKGAHAA